VSEHLGKICPYCKSEIKADDDVVQCSECDMPHHKDCFIENQGCTTFGCSGSMSSAASSAAAADPELVYCSSCGAKSSIRNAYCSYCGNPLGVDTRQMVLNPNFWKPQQDFAYDDREAFIANVYYFVEKKALYYTAKFEKMRNSGNTASWNWPAFFFSFMWFAYRKMYGIAFGILALNFFLLLLPGSASNLILSVVSGIMGNNLYYKFYLKESEKARLMPDVQRHQYLSSRGGTSAGAVWGMIILWIVLAGITN